MRAVVSADIIGSSELPTSVRKKIPDAVKKAFAAASKYATRKKTRYEIRRGDFIQAELQPLIGLRSMMLLKANVNQLTNEHQTQKQENILVDLRLSLAVDEVSYSASSVGESDGPAYQLSGRGLDELKPTRHQIVLQTSDVDFNEELEVMARSLEFITSKWTRGSAEIVSLLLQEQKEIEIAAKLGISQSAVNQRKKTAGWEVIQAMLLRFEKKIGVLNNTKKR